MSIKIIPAVQADLSELLAWIQNSKDADVQQLQAETMVILGLIINEKFVQKIHDLRQKYQIPKHWHTPKHNNNYFEEYYSYLETHPDVQIEPFSPVILGICDEFGIDRKKYAEFISNYLFFGNVQVLKPPHLEWFDHYYTTDEYRNKASIVIDYGEGNDEALSETPQAVLIKIYKDTSKTGLISFIEKNWNQISQIQKQLKPYPHNKRYGRFKRDIQIYIYHLLGYSTSAILDALANDDIYLEETAVRQTIVDIGKRINPPSSPSKL